MSTCAYYHASLEPPAHVIPLFAGWGMFAAQVIEPGAFVMEYIGEIIRLTLSDVREKHYRAAKQDDYMFRIDSE